MRGSTIVPGLLMAAAALAGCGAQAPQQAKATAMIEPRADQALRAMSATLATAKSFRFQVAADVDERSPAGKLVQAHRDSTILVRRPNAVAAELRSDYGRWSLAYRGDKLSIWRGDRNQYATARVPASIDGMLDFLFDEYGLTIPLADLLLADPYGGLSENVRTGVYVGLHTIDARPCHHLLFAQDNVDWQVWIDSGGKPLPLKVVITYKKEPGQPEYTARLHGWDLAPAAPDSAFALQPPAGAATVDMAALQLGKGQ